MLALDASADVAKLLLARALRARGQRGVRVKPEEANVAHALAGAGILRLEERVEGTVAAPCWVPWRVSASPDAESEISEFLGLLDPSAERASLLQALPVSPLLQQEVKLLEGLPPDAGLKPPPGSVLANISWSTYAPALCAVAEWERARANGERLSLRELAARAFGSSKAWTPSRRAAFHQLVGIPLEQAVGGPERFVRVRGPLKWRLGERSGDARAARPWVGLPALAIEEAQIDCSEAVGTFVVENLETFEEVVRRTDVAERWICIYGGGYADVAVVRLIVRIGYGIVAWCDLDPDGIRIAEDLRRRSGLPVTLVAMEPALLHGPNGQPASDRQRQVAREMVGTAPLDMQSLAIAIAETGRVCEQEALHAAVLPELANRLALSLRET
jgi:hypothetical protein